MCRALLAADDFHVLVEQLAAVEQLVVIHHPISEVVNLFENTGGLRVVEVELTSRKQALDLDAIPVTLDECGQRGDERPAFIRLHRTAKIDDGFHVVAR